MGDAVSTDTYTPQQRTKYRRQLMNDLEVFDRHLQKADFESRGSIGLELELNLIDENMQPARKGPEVLALLGEDYQSEIGMYNVELNHPPLSVAGDGLQQLHAGITRRVSAVREAAATVGARVAMIGTLPTVTPEFLADPSWMVPENRYRGLNNAIMQSRGELVHIDLSNEEECSKDFDDIAPESTCTSMQLHLQVPPDRFTHAWNAAQAMASVQVALAANSPLFLGRKLWHESQIPVFQQAIDTRTPELVAQGVRPRVWFGERWITSVFDLFEENVRYFSPLLPESREDSGKPIVEGQSPTLHHLNLHNGTVWRWNRPIYAPGLQRAHIRVENRILPAGPTVVDIVADAAFYYGLVKHLAEETRPVWSRLPFETAEQNFFYGAQAGMFARLEWPTLGRIDVASLIEDHLLEQARAGLRALEVDEELITYYLDIIRERARTRQNGAMWQLRTVKALTPSGSKPDSPERRAALAEMLRRYLANQATGEPVHTWKISG